MAWEILLGSLRANFALRLVGYSAPRGKERHSLSQFRRRSRQAMKTLIAFRVRSKRDLVAENLEGSAITVMPIGGERPMTVE
jgi:hypothetical protein